MTDLCHLCGQTHENPDACPGREAVPLPMTSYAPDEPDELIVRHVEAALCLWEWMTENRDDNPHLSAAWEAMGTAHMRFEAIRAAHYIDGVYNLIPADTRDLLPFDWEFVPRIAQGLRWDAGARTLFPDSQALADLVAADVEAGR
jgi:hypothetical protein